jgi:hypothetical protein
MICHRCNIIFEDRLQICEECHSPLIDPFKPRDFVDHTKTSKNKANKQEIFQWEGHQIVIRVIAPAKYLWMATINQLWIDGHLLAISGGFNFSSQAKCTIHHQGKTVNIVLQTRTRASLAGGLNYDFRVDDISRRTGMLKFEMRWSVPNRLE